jgi:D-amino-acid dehydrogenase
MKNIGIIGGGIIGLCSAYYLNKAGHKVTVFEQGDLKDGCSFRNAGMIVPSHIIPMAAPGMISKGIRWMFQSASPFYIRPRLSRGLIRWGYLFYKSSTKEYVERSVTALKEISLLSKAQYQQLAKELPFDFGFQERGLLMLYQTEESEREEAEMAKVANRNGIDARILDCGEIQALEPEVKVKVRGGVYFPGDAHLSPQQLMDQLVPFLQSKGVVFQTQTAITDFVIDEGMVKNVKAKENEYRFDELVVAAGSWSGLLCSRFGLSLPLQTGKGYSFTLTDVERNIRVPSIFIEARVAVTPMGNSLRFGGTMEIAGIDHRINMNRVKGIVDAIPRYYPGMNVPEPKEEDVWHGLRPCSPDGLPYIGRLSSLKNVILATGHSMMGLSLGPGTGKLIAEIVNEERPGIDMRPFDSERFS